MMDALIICLAAALTVGMSTACVALIISHLSHRDL